MLTYSDPKTVVVDIDVSGTTTGSPRVRPVS